MFIKEYRILLPLSVAEYRIAQLYMIQKKSRMETSGVDSGVEILKNEPYTDGPGGNGQYTYKIYHIGSHIPVWIRGVMPGLLQAHEEAWNAYPYTKTRYTCPLLDHFFVEVETRYFDDAGTQENVFNLSHSDQRRRVIDYMDFVKDNVSPSEYCKEEDPKLFKSVKTGRGPLNDDWVQEHVSQRKPIMCSYKLCRVEFRYWGMQTRVERWIHDLALRRVMLRAHRQAWTWMDEWIGLTIDDIRRLEADTQAHLNSVMSAALCQSQEVDDEPSSLDRSQHHHNQSSPSRSPHSSPFDAIRSDSEESIYFECADASPPASSQKASLIRWSSDLILAGADDDDSPPPSPRIDIGDCQIALLILVFHGGIAVEDPSAPTVTPKMADVHTLRSTVDSLIIAHYPQLLGRVSVQLVACDNSLVTNALSSLSMLCPYGGDMLLFDGFCHPALVSLMATEGDIFEQAVSKSIEKANRVYDQFITSDDGRRFSGEVFIIGDCIGGLLAYGALIRSRHTTLSRNHSSVSARSDVSTVIPEEDISGTGIDIDIKQQAPTSVFSIGETGAASVTLRERQLSTTSDELIIRAGFSRNLSAPPTGRTRRLGSTSDTNNNHLSFKVVNLFLFGCPLGLVLVHRRLASSIDTKDGAIVCAPNCSQIFNLYYPVDPCAVRLEPLLCSALTCMAPMTVPRYQRFPLGNGETCLLGEHLKRAEERIITSEMETNLLKSWWGNKRIDYALYCPDGVSAFPSTALPNILHASYWESEDVCAFVLRQFVIDDQFNGFASTVSYTTSSSAAAEPFQMLDPSTPTEKWLRRRTRYKIKNVSANHRGNDVLITEGADQVLSARFCYGPMDVVVLSGEQVDIYVCDMAAVNPEWQFYVTETTDAHGRISVHIDKQRELSLGVHQVKMVVKGDHTYLDMFIAVVPLHTECVVFSIDGSFTASVSVTGKDPKVRPGAVDVVRYWQELGYLILYVTARPDMQQRQVGAWLAQHNFPHGLLFFTGSLSTDPLRQKTLYLKQLISLGIQIHCAYGSLKDVPVYTSAGVDTQRIFVVTRKAPKKSPLFHIIDSYSIHLHELATGGCLQSCGRAAQGNARLVLRKGVFLSSYYGPTSSTKKTIVQRSQSFTPRSGKFESSGNSLTDSTSRNHRLSPFRALRR